VTHHEPVLFLQEQRDLVRVAQKHEGHCGARAEFGLFEQPRPILVAQADEHERRGRNHNLRAAQ
jgi:hypothetical protein